MTKSRGIGRGNYERKMRTECRMCGTHLDDNNVSGARGALCKKCYADLSKYKRLALSDDLKPSQEAFLKSMDWRFIQNEMYGMYFPPIFKQRQKKAK